MRGFTLLEILLVMVLIAILTAAAVNTINFAVNDADAGTEAERVAALAGLAAEEALLTGREYGLRIDAEELQFFIFDDLTGQWLPLTDDATFHPRAIPEGLDLDLVLDGQAIMLGEDAAADAGTAEPPDDRGGGKAGPAGDSEQPASGDEEDETAPEPPQLVFLSSGQITPFTLTVTELDPDGERWIVAGDLLGRMTVEQEAQ
ncbi:MAG TPA: type II secretion system minor pseudopilin GspH [Gammaproteobacteria bacterium]